METKRRPRPESALLTEKRSITLRTDQADAVRAIAATEKHRNFSRVIQNALDNEIARRATRNGDRRMTIACIRCGEAVFISERTLRLTDDVDLDGILCVDCAHDELADDVRSLIPATAPR